MIFDLLVKVYKNDFFACVCRNSMAIMFFYIIKIILRIATARFSY